MGRFSKSNGVVKIRRKVQDKAVGKCRGDAEQFIEMESLFLATVDENNTDQQNFKRQYYDADQRPYVKTHTIFSSYKI